MSYSSPYGFPETVEVFISSASLRSLEERSNSAILATSVKHILINLSHYDASYVQDKGLFAAQCQHWHLLDCDYNERFSSTIHRPTPSSEFNAFKEATFDESKATPIQQEILKSHEDYTQKFNDQEAIRKDGIFATRLATAISKMSNLMSLTIHDEYKYTPTGRLSMDRSPWKSGSRDGPSSTDPPVEVIAQLFQALKGMPICAVEFSLKLGAPRDLKPLQLDEEQQTAVKKVLERSKKSSFQMSEWNRGPGKDNTRSREELIALGTMTKAILSTPNLESIALWLSDFYIQENPQPSLHYLLPLSPDDQWQPKLRELKLQWISAPTSDLQILVDKFGDSVTWLDLWYCHLAEGQWVDAFETLHGFKHLEKVRCAGCTGGEVGWDRWRGPRSFPGDEAKRYLLRESGVLNPLRFSKN